MNTMLLKLRANELRQFTTSTKKWSPWIVTVWFALGEVATFIILWWERRAIGSVIGLFKSADSASIYAWLRSWLVLVESIVVQLEIGILILWAWLSYGIYLLTKFVVGLMMERIAPEDPLSSRRAFRYLSVTSRTVGRRLQAVFIFFFALAGGILIVFKVWMMDLNNIVDIYVITVAAFCPVVWFTTWFQYFKIRNTRRPAMRLAWDEYLFSKSALSRILKIWLQFMTFLAILGLVLIPGLFTTMHRIEQTGAWVIMTEGNYSKGWSYLVADGYPAGVTIVNKDLDLPAPDQLEWYLSLASALTLRTEMDGWITIQKFQKGMYELAVLVLILTVGIPLTASAVLFRERREMLRSTLSTTIRTTALFTGLSVFFRLAFFQDITSAFGVAAVATFVIRYLVTLRQRM